MGDQTDSIAYFDTHPRTWRCSASLHPTTEIFLAPLDATLDSQSDSGTSPSLPQARLRRPTPYLLAAHAVHRTYASQLMRRCHL